MEPQIRPYQVHDAVKINNIYCEHMGCFEKIKVTPQFIDRCANRSDFTYYVAQAGDETVGFAGAQWYQCFARAEVGPLAVTATSQRMRVGQRLHEKIISHLNQLGVKRVVAKVKADNSQGTRFFLKNGYVQEAYLRSYTMQSEDVIQYVRFI